MAEAKFVSYLRVSTDKQGKSGLGLEAQRAAVDDYLNGGRWKLLEEFVEVETGKGVSCYDDYLEKWPAARLGRGTQPQVPAVTESKTTPGQSTTTCYETMGDGGTMPAPIICNATTKP